MATAAKYQVPFQSGGSSQTNPSPIPKSNGVANEIGNKDHGSMGSIEVNTENSSVKKSSVTATPSGQPWTSVKTEQRNRSFSQEC